jgi:hypothetical protein
MKRMAVREGNIRKYIRKEGQQLDGDAKVVIPEAQQLDGDAKVVIPEAQQLDGDATGAIPRLMAYPVMCSLEVKDLPCGVLRLGIISEAMKCRQIYTDVKRTMKMKKWRRMQATDNEMFKTSERFH